MIFLYFFLYGFFKLFDLFIDRLIVKDDLTLNKKLIYLYFISIKCIHLLIKVLV